MPDREAIRRITDQLQEYAASLPGDPAHEEAATQIAGFFKSLTQRIETQAQPVSKARRIRSGAIEERSDSWEGEEGDVNFGADDDTEYDQEDLDSTLPRRGRKAKAKIEAKRDASPSVVSMTKGNDDLDFEELLEKRLEDVAVANSEATAAAIKSAVDPLQEKIGQLLEVLSRQANAQAVPVSAAQEVVQNAHVETASDTQPAQTQTVIPAVPMPQPIPQNVTGGVTKEQLAKMAGMLPGSSPQEAMRYAASGVVEPAGPAGGRQELVNLMKSMGYVPSSNFVQRPILGVEANGREQIALSQNENDGDDVQAAIELATDMRRMPYKELNRLRTELELW